MLRQLTKKINVGRLMQRFEKTTLLVVGDIVVDQFIWGTVSRISPEAPVPVVAVSSESLLLGGAANVVNNIRSLNGKALIAGIIGRDSMGEILRRLLTKRGCGLEGLVEDGNRPTTVKTRIIAHSQQVVRFDREQVAQVSPETRDQIISYVETHWDEVDGVVVSDYGKGVVTRELMGFLLDKAARDDKLVAVDPKMNNFDVYRGATIVTPNSAEAEFAAGLQIRDENSLLHVGSALLERFASKAVLITRGEAGMVLFEKNGDVTKVPTVAKEVYDVTGAGDTVISTLTLALAAGNDFAQAAVLANYAAGIVVGKVGTATVTPEELKRAIADYVRG